MKRSEIFKDTKRVVIKIGTQVLTSENDRLDTSVIEHIVEQVSQLINRQHKEIIVVTSGAIAAGMQVLGWRKRPKSINKLQAAASIGQSRLMRIYERLFKEEGLKVGQILLTRDVFSCEERKNTAKNTVLTLLKLKVVPIINENDSVAVDEIKFGDNDTLSCLVAELIGADMLIMVTDVDGLCNSDPKKDVKTKIISSVKDMEKINNLSLEGCSARGMGGIQSKIAAANYMVGIGKSCIILNGKSMWSLKKASEGKRVGTLFSPVVKN